jgi:hypothetical protein
MEAADEIERLKNDLVALRGAGQRGIAIQALQQYLEKLEIEPCPSPEEKQRQLQKTLAQYDATNELNLEIFRSGDDAGKEALKASLLINGGAVIAILSFLGAVVGKGIAGKLGLALVQPLLAFGCGVLSTAVAFGARYLTTYAYGLERPTWATRFNILAIVLTLVSYTAFSLGVYWAYLAFGAHFSNAP